MVYAVIDVFKLQAGAKSQHDKIAKVDMAGFRYGPTSRKSRYSSEETAGGDAETEVGQQVRFYAVPAEIKHREGLEACLSFGSFCRKKLFDYSLRG